jgi:hypothetical protein
MFSRLLGFRATRRRTPVSATEMCDSEVSVRLGGRSRTPKACRTAQTNVLFMGGKQRAFRGPGRCHIWSSLQWQVLSLFCTTRRPLADAKSASEGANTLLLMIWVDKNALYVALDAAAFGTVYRGSY